jgi:hypothetical protein
MTLNELHTSNPFTFSNTNEGFYKAFDTIWYSRRSQYPGRWTRSQTENFLKGARAALWDSWSNRSNFQVVVAPKGASKTTSAMALIPTILQCDPTASVVVALP